MTEQNNLNSNDNRRQPLQRRNVAAMYGDSDEVVAPRAKRVRATLMETDEPWNNDFNRQSITAPNAIGDVHLMIANLDTESNKLDGDNVHDLAINNNPDVCTTNTKPVSFSTRKSQI